MHPFCNGTVAGINCMLCLEMLYLFWLSPHTSFTMSLPCYSFTRFIGFVASQGLFRPINDRVYDVYLILGEARLWVSKYMGLSLWPSSQARCPPKNCWVERCSLCPWGNSSYNWPIVFLQAVNCSAGGGSWLWVAFGVPQRPVTMTLRKL